ncbi:methyl-accepting chemotaxis protein [Phenylobacterium sp.]|uniref:HAMP domain-containing methyl-accepting chemotaxis protein n=1 Tax=Phenylobacterium sp. TaxID=1871053 RepID=UPI00273546A8|nr:methyl-accepting chemotaxis protein [Phenylobacterium sp.]MDP3632440.1 methyl-accepting chemotaxis protein [Phenylobacterium sp.]
MLKTIKAKLTFSIGALGAALVVIGLCGWFALDFANAKIKSIVADRVVPMEQLKTVSDMYAVSIVDTAWKVRTGQLPWADGQARVNTATAELHKSWSAYAKTKMTPEETTLAQGVTSAMTDADAAVTKLQTLLAAQDQAGLEAFTGGEMYPAIEPVTDKVSALVDLQISAARADGAAAARASGLFHLVMGALSLAAAGILAFGFKIVIGGVSRPLQAMTSAMRRLSGGDNSVEVPAVGRADEIGEMAAAMLVFKAGSIEREKLAAEAANFQQELDRKLKEMEAAFEASGLAQKAVVEAMGRELQRLARGDLTARLSESVAADYQRLQTDFNTAVAQLQDAMAGIASSSGGIRNGANEISQASDDLSRRTEQQAAGLEETAAALEEITATVTRTARGAAHARDVVAKTTTDADNSAQVVRSAVEAMGKIEASAQEISQIIGVIDEIAFQTNLLALNAGVEAARAGDAGKGFAVVASEVRALAQRSAEAAKEIKALISASTAQVNEGVSLVGQTGEALERIAVQISQINGVVSEIAASAQEQATGLHQVNTAVTQMDQMTQQNAAMVEQSTAAGHSLRNEADTLMTLINKFDVGAAGVALRPAAQRPTARTPTAPALRIPAPSGAATARKLEPQAQGEGWEEF